MTMGNIEQSALTKTTPGWVAGAMGQALRWVVLPAAAVGTIAGVGVATGGVSGSAVMAALANPLSVLAARSPGARATGALTQTKLRKATPAEGVLSNALTRPLDRFAAPGLGGTAPGAAPADTVGDTVTDAVADLPVPPTGPGSFGPIGIGFIPTPGGFVVTPNVGGTTGGGGGGTGGGGSTPPDTSVTPVSPAVPVTPVTPVAAVPEPATWLTLLLGFGAIGGALRSRRRVTTRAEDVSPALQG